MFQEELEKARRDAKHAQQLAAAAEREKIRFSDEKRVADARADRAEQQAEVLRAELAQARQRVAAADEQIQQTVVLEQRANAEHDRAERLDRELQKLRRDFDAATEKLRDVSRDLADTRAELDKRVEEFARAERVVAALRQRAEADRVLSGEV